MPLFLGEAAWDIIWIEFYNNSRYSSENLANTRFSASHDKPYWMEDTILYPIAKGV